MNGPADTKDGVLSSDASQSQSVPGGRPRDSQKTVFLSEVPDAKTMVDTQSQAEQTGSNSNLSTGGSTGPLGSRSPSSSASGTDPRGTHPTLSSTALVALGQRYEVLSEAGHGSMGNVYKARDLETGEIVALKLLKPEIASDQTMMERFKNELLFARKITHKNVCRVHEFNRINGVAYTSMEFVEGESLRSVLNRFGGLPMRKAIDVTQQICSGLKEAHAQGIVHRDLKPENVMVDALGNIKIMDFGIARSMEAGTRLTGSMMGTPAYMAPEQVAGKPIDYRTDIYSLGLILYEMFAGTPAFHAETAVAVALKQLREAPPAPHTVNPSIPVGIERAILKCIEKEPEKRFQSIAELEKALGSTSAEPAASIPVAGSATRSSNPGGQAVVRPAAMPNPMPRTSPKAKSKGASAIVWLLVGAGSVLAAAGASRWAARAKSAEQIPPPTVQLHMPTPPEFAYEKPVLTADNGAAAGAPSPDATPATANGKDKPAAPPAKTEAAKRPDIFPKVELPGPKMAQMHPPDVPPPDIGEPRFQNGRQDGGLGIKKGADVYLFINRFGKEERAQEAASRLETMGLRTSIISRRGITGEVFILLTGPFGEQKALETEQKLENQGYKMVRPVDYPGQEFREPRPR